MSEKINSQIVTPYKVHLIKLGNVKQMRSIHYSLTLRQFIASVKAWDYSKVTLMWVSALLRYLHDESRIKGKKIGFQNKTFFIIL